MPRPLVAPLSNLQSSLALLQFQIPPHVRRLERLLLKALGVSTKLGRKVGQARDVTAGPCQTGDKAVPDRIVIL